VRPGTVRTPSLTNTCCPSQMSGPRLRARGGRGALFAPPPLEPALRGAGRGPARHAHDAGLQAPLCVWNMLLEADAMLVVPPLLGLLRSARRPARMAVARGLCGQPLFGDCVLRRDPESDADSCIATSSGDRRREPPTEEARDDDRIE